MGKVRIVYWVYESEPLMSQPIVLSTQGSKMFLNNLWMIHGPWQNPELLCRLLVWLYLGVVTSGVKHFTLICYLFICSLTVYHYLRYSFSFVPLDYLSPVRPFRRDSFTTILARLVGLPPWWVIRTCEGVRRPSTYGSGIPFLLVSTELLDLFPVSRNFFQILYFECQLSSVYFVPELSGVLP